MFSFFAKGISDEYKEYSLFYLVQNFTVVKWQIDVVKNIVAFRVGMRENQKVKDLLTHTHIEFLRNLSSRLVFSFAVFAMT